MLSLIGHKSINIQRYVTSDYLTPDWPGNILKILWARLGNALAWYEQIDNYMCWDSLGNRQLWQKVGNDNNKSSVWEKPLLWIFSECDNGLTKPKCALLSRTFVWKTKSDTDLRVPFYMGWKWLSETGKLEKQAVIEILLPLETFCINT